MWKPKIRIIYAKDWSYKLKQCIEIIPKSEAEKLYAKKHSFVVVAEQNIKLFCIIEFNNRYIYVCFFDKYNRNYLNYEYYIYNYDNLFLNKLFLNRYYFEVDIKIAVLQYAFTPEGDYRMEYIMDGRKVSETGNKIDTAILWEKYPKFDNYSKLIETEKKYKIIRRKIKKNNDGMYGTIV